MGRARAAFTPPSISRSCGPATSTIAELAQLEVPWSPEVVEGFRLMTGGTHRGRAPGWRHSAPRSYVHIGGGLHHAFAEPRRRLLPVQRCRGRHARAASTTGSHRARGGDRSRRAPWQRHGVHLRARTAGVHVLDAPAAQLPGVQAAGLARHRAARRRRATKTISSASRRACRRCSRVSPMWCAIWPAPIRSSRTISSAVSR